MTEAEWNACTEPRKMLEFLRTSRRASDRKLRLFAVACCRRIWPGLVDERSRQAVEVAENFADGWATHTEREGAANAAWYACSNLDHFNATDAAHDACLVVVEADRVAEGTAHDAAWTAASEAERLSGRYLQGRAGKAAWELERASQAALLRDIFGPLPFRQPPPLAPPLLRWNDGIVVRMANAIYDNRHLSSGHFASDRLAVLADCIEDAGCIDAQLLAHLRGEGPHVRGCWVIDLLLGKS